MCSLFLLPLIHECCWFGGLVGDAQAVSLLLTKISISDDRSIFGDALDIYSDATEYVAGLIFSHLYIASGCKRQANRSSPYF